MPPDSDSDTSSMPGLESISSSGVLLSSFGISSDEADDDGSVQCHSAPEDDYVKIFSTQGHTKSSDDLRVLGSFPDRCRVDRLSSSAPCSPSISIPRIGVDSLNIGNEDQLPYLLSPGTWIMPCPE